MPAPWDQLLGPAGLAVALLFAVVALWRDHLRADADDRAIRDRSLAGWEAQVAATEKLAATLEKQAEDIAGRRRVADR